MNDINIGKKRSLGITIISRFEMVVGTIGILFIIPFLWIFCFGSESDGRADGLAIALIWGIPSVILLIMGELTFRLKPAGRILHLTIPIVVVILFTLQLTRTMYSLLLPDFGKLSLIVSIGLMLFSIYFFNRPKIKEQFK